MRIDTSILRSINVTRFAKYVVFNTCDISPEVDAKAQKGLDCLEKMVTEMLSQDVLPYAVRFSDVAQLVGTNTKDAKRTIRNLLKLGHECYDGTYGRPIVIEPERALYITTALVIQEYGRKSANPIEYTVRYNISDFIDIGAIENEYDMANYVFLIDYFERCLHLGKISISKFMKDNCSNLVTQTRLKRFIEKNYWYGDPESNVINNFSCLTPSVSEVANRLYKIFVDIQKIEEEMHEDWELNQAFDSKS